MELLPKLWRLGRLGVLGRANLMSFRLRNILVNLAGLFSGRNEQRHLLGLRAYGEWRLHRVVETLGGPTSGRRFCLRILYR